MNPQIIVLMALTVGAASAKDQCSEWQSTPAFTSKADCEETTRVSNEWSSSCSKAREKAGFWPENLSAADGSTFAFCEIEDAKATTNAVLLGHKNDQKVQESWKGLRAKVLSHWEDTRDVFCLFHPSAAYLVDGDHIGAHCPADGRYAGVPDKRIMDKLFDEDPVLTTNITTFANSQLCEDLRDPNEQKSCLQRQFDAYKPLLDSIKSQKK